MARSEGALPVLHASANLKPTDVIAALFCTWQPPPHVLVISVDMPSYALYCVQAAGEALATPILFLLFLAHGTVQGVWGAAQHIWTQGVYGLMRCDTLGCWAVGALATTADVCVLAWAGLLGCACVLLVGGRALLGAPPSRTSLRTRAAGATMHSL
jgi:hypothetical protein